MRPSNKSGCDALQCGRGTCKIRHIATCPIYLTGKSFAPRPLPLALVLSIFFFFFPSPISFLLRALSHDQLIFHHFRPRESRRRFVKRLIVYGEQTSKIGVKVAKARYLWDRGKKSRTLLELLNALTPCLGFLPV